MLFTIGDFVVNIEAARIGEERENTPVKNIRFNEHDAMAFMNHINAYICIYNESPERNRDFNQIFDQLAAYGYFGKDWQKLYSK